MRTDTVSFKRVRLAMIAVLVLAPSVVGQTQTETATKTTQPGEETRPRSIVPPDPGDEYFQGIYREFYNSYKLGPEDQLALRVQGQPDYSIESATISPVGRIYHPLLGDVDVAGLTVPRLKERLTIELSQYIIDPKVSISLLSANSAKIGVLGDVPHPGIVVMGRPMTILDAIAASGGIADSGSKSNVTLLRQMGGGRSQITKINVKRILEGKANPEENVALRAGDTIIVHGNTRKKITAFTSMLGFGQFLGFVRGF